MGIKVFHMITCKSIYIYTILKYTPYTWKESAGGLTLCNSLQYTATHYCSVLYMHIFWGEETNTTCTHKKVCEGECATHKKHIYPNKWSNVRSETHSLQPSATQCNRLLQSVCTYIRTYIHLQTCSNLQVDASSAAVCNTLQQTVAVCCTYICLHIHVWTCSNLQVDTFSAAACNTLQSATNCNLQHTAICNTLQSATHCNLQHTATDCCRVLHIHTSRHNSINPKQFAGRLALCNSRQRCNISLHCVAHVYICTYIHTHVNL